ncbi:hypothetical protein HMPREF9694_03906 [Klebsiella michiganensis]|nr:hypothetical protein HMPREF9694_03906 [Klebsiella michiganensis]
MSVSSLDHQQIVGVVKRVGEGLLLLEHLYPVDTCDAQCFGAAVQLAGVLAVMMMQFGVTRIRIGILSVNSGSRTCSRWWNAECPNQDLSPLCGNEKEQNRLAVAQKTGEIGRQMSDVLVTQGKLNAHAVQR